MVSRRRSIGFWLRRLLPSAVAACLFMVGGTDAAVHGAWLAAGICAGMVLLCAMVFRSQERDDA